MPTIEELAPASATADTDLIMVQQSGVTRKATRAQMIAGLQPQLAIASGTLVGRKSPGVGSPEAIAIGANLVLNGGTLSATSAPYVIAGLPQGAVPSSNDRIPLSQNGTNTALSLAQFFAGLTQSSIVDASSFTIKPHGTSYSIKLSDFAASTLTVSGGTLTGPLTLYGDPTSGAHAATKHYVDGRVARAGDTLSGALTLAADPVSPLQAATKRYVDTQVAGTRDYVLSKGICVNFRYSYNSNTALPSNAAGAGILLTGSAAFTITLPAASTVPAGIGYTFSVIGSGAVTIASSGTDTVDCAPIVLGTNDRYQVVSDGGGRWREVFRTNAVNPRFSAPPILPSCSVATLPGSLPPGAKAFASDGRKPTDPIGGGTGVEVFFDGSHWISVCSGLQVQA